MARPTRALRAAQAGIRPVAPHPEPPPDPAAVMNQLVAEATGLFNVFMLHNVPPPLAAALAANLAIEPGRRGERPLPQARLVQRGPEVVTPDAPEGAGA